MLNENGSEQFDSIPANDRFHDPLPYFLLLSHGTDGWHLGYHLHNIAPRCRQNLRTFAMMSDIYQLFQLPDMCNTILCGGSLFRKCYVNLYYKVGRSKYLCRNQVFLRATDYASLCKQLVDPGRTENKTDSVLAGRMFILPSTYVGGDRDMCQSMHNIIAILNKVGHPDIFLTMTCKRQWPRHKKKA